MYRSELSYTVGGNVNGTTSRQKSVGGSLKVLKIELTYDSAIPFTLSEKIII